jgi:HSP20 family molecular chaperone IbpA
VYRDPTPNIRWRKEVEGVWRPPTDVYETDDSVVVIVEIAGLAGGDFEISLDGRVLIVSGERHDPAEKLAYQQMEIRYGRFRTEVHVPWALESSGQSAIYEDGFVRITLRKAQSRRVPVKVSQGEQADR